jgi:transcriptional regulator with PAS, ATPase and Fis domain
MKNVLIAWIGRTDLRASTETDFIGLGPIAQAIESRNFNHIFLLNNYAEPEAQTYSEWLRKRTPVPLTIQTVNLSSPTNFGEIYKADVKIIEKALHDFGNKALLTFHLSPGTPAMAAVWILLAKARYPAELIESSLEQGVITVSIPFDISAEFIPTHLKKSDERLERLIAGLPLEAPEFDNIIHRSAVMKNIVAKARRIAPRSVPVLIEGESGTGKELLARAIHRSSPKKDKPFIAVNCGAIPAELVESELFGHKKGAFTGASQDRKGYFEAANGGTLFLDEIGELPLTAQVKILRVLQEFKVVRLGDTGSIDLDIRIIAATNRNLVQEVASGQFRADLYYRLAVAVLQLPPLREREGDISLLIDHFLDQINRESAAEPGYLHKKISSSARNIMLSYPWPGNARELLNIIRRAAVWSPEETISVDDIREILIPQPSPLASEIKELSLGDGVNLPDILANTAREYLTQGLRETGGNKTRAAKLLGLPNYQTLTNWLEKYGVSE